MAHPYPIFSPQSNEEMLRGWLLHSHKSRDRHDFAARRCDSLRYIVGVPTIVLAAIVGTSVFSALGKEPVMQVNLLVGLVSVASAVFAALQTFLDYPGRAERHRAAAAKYKGMIHELEQALCDGPGEVPHEATLLTGIQGRLADLEELSPVVPQKIYDQVEQRYKAYTFVPHAQDLAPHE